MLGDKYPFKVINKTTRSTFIHSKQAIDVVLVIVVLTFNIISFFSSVFIVDFEQVNVFWADRRFFSGFIVGFEQEFANIVSSRVGTLLQ